MSYQVPVSTEIPEVSSVGFHVLLNQVPKGLIESQICLGVYFVIYIYLYYLKERTPGQVSHVKFILINISNRHRSAVYVIIHGEGLTICRY
jgi:ABC-type methionine transport system permease subunit